MMNWIQIKQGDKLSLPPSCQLANLGEPLPVIPSKNSFFQPDRGSAIYRWYYTYQN